MRHVIFALLAVGAAARVAAAQPDTVPTTPTPAPAPAPAEPPAVAALDVFLEQRVADELAAEGTPLSRRGVELDIEQIGDRLLISLVDLATRRALASTKLDTIPADREAAVASVTPLVAGLVRQIDGAVAARPPGSMPEAVVEMLAEDREERREDAREAKRQRKIDVLYDEEALWLGSEYALFGVATTTGGTTTMHFGSTRRWSVHQGRVGGRLSAVDFYRTIGRDDLEDAYDTRKRRGWILTGVGSVLIGASLYFGLGPGSDYTVDQDSIPSCVMNRPSCSQDVRDKEEQLERTRTTYRTAGAIALGGAFITGLIGAWYLLNPHPISEREAANLAREYNAGMRRRLDRSVRLGNTALRDVRLAPAATADGGGLVLSGRF
jgi:hypothetical protein